MADIPTGLSANLARGGGISTHPASLITRPGAHPAKNVRQAGAPNHLEGSGENHMVGTTTAPEAAPEVPRWFAALLNRNALLAGMPRQGKGVPGWPALCSALLDEITTLQAERDAADDAVLELLAERDELTEDLAWALNANHTTGTTAPASGTDSDAAGGGA